MSDIGTEEVEINEATRKAAKRLGEMVTRAVLRGPGNVVSVPTEGVWLVVDGEVREMRLQFQSQHGWIVHLEDPSMPEVPE